MKGKGLGTIAIVTALVSALGGSALSAQDKYTVKVPGTGVAEREAGAFIPRRIDVAHRGFRFTICSTQAHVD